MEGINVARGVPRYLVSHRLDGLVVSRARCHWPAVVGASRSACICGDGLRWACSGPYVNGSDVKRQVEAGGPMSGMRIPFGAFGCCSILTGAPPPPPCPIIIVRVPRCPTGLSKLFTTGARSLHSTRTSSLLLTRRADPHRPRRQGDRGGGSTFCVSLVSGTVQGAPPRSTGTTVGSRA